MNMKKGVVVTLVAGLFLAAGVPAFANQCPTLIKQANDKIATMDKDSDTVKKAKELVAEADRLHKAGNHSESVAKAQAALAALK